MDTNQAIRAGDGNLPPLPETVYRLFYEDDGDEDHGDEGYQEVLDEPGYTAKEMRDYARAAMLAAAPAAAPAWQPIETAPRDGSEVLIFEVYERLPVIGWWSEKRKRWYASTEVYDTDGDATVIDKLYTDGVTHWMPLPAPPEIPSPATGDAA